MPKIFIDKKDGGFNTLFYALLYLLLTHIFFWRFLVPGQLAFGTDTMAASYPVQQMAVEQMIKDRSIMLWNPYIFSGMPFLASFSFPFFYPPTVLFFILPTFFGMTYEIIIHFFLMGLFMFLFLRHLKLSKPAAFVGGLLFMFNGHLVSLVYPGHGSKLFTMTYLPLALMFLDRAFDSKPYYNMAIMGLFVGLMFYGGHIQIMFYCGIALLLFMLMRILTGVREKGLVWALKGVSGFGLAFALGALLYAVILFPAWEYRGFTHRAGGVTGASSYQFATSFSQPPEDLLYVGLRDPFGWGKDYGPQTPTTSGIFYRGRIGLRLSVDYFSVLGLVLAMAGLVFARDRYTILFGVLAMVTAFFSLGMFNPLYPLVYKYIPGFSLFRVPYAIMILMPICGGTLAAYGLDALMKMDPSGNRKLGYFIYAGAGVYLAVLGVALWWGTHVGSVSNWLLNFGWVRQMLWEDYSDLPRRFRYFVNNLGIFLIFFAVSLLFLFAYRRKLIKARHLAIVASLIILADLWPMDWEFIKTLPREVLETRYFKETPEVAALENDKDKPFRTLSLVYNNELLIRDLQTLAGYHAVPLGYYEKVMDRLNFDNPIVDMLNARYLMLPKEPEYDFRHYPFEPARKKFEEKYELLGDGDFFFYRNRQAMPRAWFVNRFLKVDDADQALDVISDPGFRPMEAAVLTDDPPPNVPPAGDIYGRKAEVTSYGPDRVELSVTTPVDSFLVMSEVWYPGWKAYIDGKAAKVYRADYVLRGVAVPQGEHRLVMVFSPVTFKAGAAVSIVTLLFFAAVIAVPIYRKRRNG